MFNYRRKRSPLSRLIGAVERLVKGALFDCSMCGQCILRSTGMACVMRCPKQLRNGPCGGTVNGKCEVDPTMTCAWVRAYERAAKLGKAFDRKLDIIQPPVDWRLWGTSSWENVARGVITLDGHPAAGKLELPIFPHSPRRQSKPWPRRLLRSLSALVTMFRQ